MESNIWAVIPARGGSTGVKRKNIKELNGKPLIAYTIDSLHKSDSFEKVIVTSDCEDILSVSKKYGADIFLRENPKESDNITMPDVPTISCLENFDKEIPDFVFMVQCTAPFIKAETFKKACTRLLENPESTVFAAEEAHYFLWKKSNNNDEDSSWETINHPFNSRVGRQFQKEMQVHETGAFYGFKASNFIKAGHRFFNDAYPIIIEGNESIDINTNDDWNFADYLSKNME